MTYLSAESTPHEGSAAAASDSAAADKGKPQNGQVVAAICNGSANDGPVATDEVQVELPSQTVVQVDVDESLPANAESSAAQRRDSFFDFLQAHERVQHFLLMLHARLHLPFLAPALGPSAPVSTASSDNIEEKSTKSAAGGAMTRATKWLRGYFAKWAGQKRRKQKYFGFTLQWQTIWSTINSFLGILLVAGVNQSLEFSGSDMIMLIGSFGASAVLLYSAWQAPLSQPRNLLGGHILSAFVGVTVQKIFNSAPDAQFVACAIAVSVAIAVMEITGTTHPPAGATSLIAVIGSPTIHNLGYLYVVMPVLCACLIMLAVALIFNNLSSKRSYPVFWY